MIKKHDKQYIKSLVEKYGVECVANSLLEYRYRTHDYSYKSGGADSSNGGMKGFRRVVVPSFLLCTLISPPTSFLLLLGAVTNRMCAKWEEQKKLMAAINPLSWAEYIATGNYKNNNDENQERTYNTNKNEFDKNTEKVIRRSTSGQEQNVHDEINRVTNQNLEGLSSSEIENLVFRYWFITFDNGEVYKVMANDKKNAENYGKAIIAHPLMLNRLDIQLKNYDHYKKLMKEKYDVYRVIYDDGQILYAIGKDENEVKATGKKMVSSYAKAYTDVFDKFNLNVNPFIVPNIKYIEKQDTLDIKFPNKITKISQSASIPNIKTNNQNNLYWENVKDGRFWQYSIFFIADNQDKPLLTMNIPCSVKNDENAAKELATRIIKDIQNPNSEYRKMFINIQAKSDYKWYKIKFKDGDVYFMYTKNEKEANSIAYEVYKTKIEKCDFNLSSENRTALNNVAYKENLLRFDTYPIKEDKYPKISEELDRIKVKVPAHTPAGESIKSYIIDKKLGDI